MNCKLIALVANFCELKRVSLFIIWFWRDFLWNWEFVYFLNIDSSVLTSFFTGLKSTYKYCDKYEIPYKKCGKIVVATSPIEIERLEQLFQRAQQNEVPEIRYLENETAIRDIEPYCRGLKAIHSPITGKDYFCSFFVDYFVTIFELWG